MNAIDTNVLLYNIDYDESIKQGQAEALLAHLTKDRATTLLLSQVAVELGAGLTRWMHSGKLSAVTRQTYFESVMAMFPLARPQTVLVTAAFNLAARHSLSYWDALLLAACIEAGVDTLYSEDFSAGVTYAGVKIVNPFL